MSDIDKTKEQLISELVETPRRITELVASEIQRKRAEEKLRESEERYRAIVEVASQAGEGICIMQASSELGGVIVFANDELARILGRAKEETIGMPSKNVIAPDSFPNLFENFRRKMKGEEVGYTEILATRKDGTTVPVEVGMAAITYQGRSSMVAYMRDITERKRAEEQLCNSERRYRLLADNTDDIIWTMDKNLQLTYMSPAIERHSGYTVEEVMGMPLEQAYTPASVEAIMKAYEEEVSLGKTGVKGQPTSRVLELEGYKKDGSTEWIEAHMTVLRDQDGNITGIVGVTRKITERKKAEEKLRIRDKAIESSINAIAIANLEGNLTYLNPSFLKLWGYDNKEEILGRPAVEFWQAEKEAAMVMRAVLEKGGWQGELVAKRKDGSVFNVELLASPVRDEYSNPICMMGCFIDITERKRAEEKLRHHYERERKLRQRLEEEIKRRVEFTRALVHELKTPVTPILASSDLLVEQLQEGPSLKLAKNIREGASTMNRRIDALLDLARGELGMLQLNRKQVDPLQLLHKVASEMSPMVSNRELSLVLDVPHSLPLVWVDGSRLQQVIANLLTNAFKWSPQGGEVTLRAKQKNNALIVEVQDMGPGIAKEKQRRIFDAYYRVESDRQRLDGLGLGLALCKTIVESHGGKIWVESEKGEGSTFGFSVPLHSDVD